MWSAIAGAYSNRARLYLRFVIFPATLPAPKENVYVV